MKELQSDLEDRLFWMPKEEEIKNGLITDVYFQYARDALKFAKINPTVTMEIFARKNPFADRWGVVCGIYEVAKLLQGLPVAVDAMEEGEVFLTDPDVAVHEPVLRITGRYQDIAIFENPILGFLSQSSGICTSAARLVHLAEGKTIISFGTRRVHPLLAPVVERSSYIGGVASVSNVLGARLMKIEASGTMPHAFILCVGDETEAWKVFDQAMPDSVPRIALVDTLSDEKFASIRAFEILGDKLYGVRLDTPSSRRGDIAKIAQEVRWELSIRGANQVKIIVSGGVGEDDVLGLRDCVDGFGIGSSIAAAPAFDFCDKIVEKEDEKGGRTFIAKRGDLAGKKNIFRKLNPFEDLVTIQDDPGSRQYEPVLKPLIRHGKLVREFLSLDELKKRTMEQVRNVCATEKPIIRWE